MPPPSKVRVILIAVAVGILFGVPLGSQGNRLLIFAVGGMIVEMVLNRKHLVAMAFCIGMIIGSTRGYFVAHIQSQYLQFYDSHSEIVADITSEPQLKNGTLHVIMRAEGFKQKIAVTMPQSADPQFGQRVILAGTMHAPQPFDDGTGGSFDYPGYLRSKGITAIESMPHGFLLGAVTRSPQFWILSLAFRLQTLFYKKILSRYAPAQQSVVKAVLFGDRSGMVSSIQEEFIRTGTIHLIAVSGFKLTILLLALQGVLQRFIPRRFLAALTIGTSLLYAAVFAFDPPVVRAAIMSTVFMLGEILGGGYDATITLVLLGGAFVFANPAMELFDSSFLFSILGVLGIMLLGPFLHKYFEKLIVQIPFRIPGISLALSFLAPAAGAYLLTLPLSLYWYGEVSMIMPITVLGIMPLFEPCIILGCASALPLVGVFAAAINQPLLHYVIWAVGIMAAIPFASLHLHISGFIAYTVYLTVGMLYTNRLLKNAPNFATIHALPIQTNYEKINNLHH